MANIQLTSTEQAKSLRDTPGRCNGACNAISQRGSDAGVTQQYDLHKRSMSIPARLRVTRRRSKASRLLLLIHAIPAELRSVGRSAGPIVRVNRRYPRLDCAYTAAADYVGTNNIRASGAALVTRAPQVYRPVSAEAKAAGFTRRIGYNATFRSQRRSHGFFESRGTADRAPHWPDNRRPG